MHARRVRIILDGAKDPGVYTCLISHHCASFGAFALTFGLRPRRRSLFLVSRSRSNGSDGGPSPSLRSYSDSTPGAVLNNVSRFPSMFSIAASVISVSDFSRLLYL